MRETWKETIDKNKAFGVLRYNLTYQKHLGSLLYPQEKEEDPELGATSHFVIIVTLYNTCHVFVITLHNSFLSLVITTEWTGTQ